MAKLGYTWYAKDWRSNMDVSELSLQEKGFYRELIDECFLKNTSQIQINERTFCRLHGINSRTFAKVLQKLHDSLLIVIDNFDETIISIPSTSKRLGVIDSASIGGKNSKAIGNNNASIKPTKSKEKSKSNTKKEIEVNSVYRSFGHLSLSKNQFTKLQSEFTKDQIDNTLNSIENYKGNKKYNSLYLTALSWLKKDVKKVTRDNFPI